MTVCHIFMVIRVRYDRVIGLTVSHHSSVSSDPNRGIVLPLIQLASCPVLPVFLVLRGGDFDRP